MQWNEGKTHHRFKLPQDPDARLPRGGSRRLKPELRQVHVYMYMCVKGKLCARLRLTTLPPALSFPILRRTQVLAQTTSEAAEEQLKY